MIKIITTTKHFYSAHYFYAILVAARSHMNLGKNSSSVCPLVWINLAWNIRDNQGRK